MLSVSRFTNIVLACCAGLVFLSCKTTQQGQVESGSDGEGKDLVVQYSRGACYGTCPVFDVYVLEDGTLLYRGRSFAPREGRYTGQLSPAEMRMLNSVLDLVRNSPFEEDLAPAAVDMPSYKIGYYQGKKWQEHEGNGEVPYHFGDIEDMVLSWVDENRWVPTNKEAFEETTQNLVKDQVILETTTEEAIKELESQYAGYQFTTLRRLSPNMPFWLITFDKRAIDPDGFLEILVSNPLVRHAEFGTASVQQGNE